MDEEQLLAAIKHLSERSNQGAGDDYGDFLANYIHAMNQGADQEDMQDLINAASPERQKAMLDYGGGPLFGEDPTIASFRSDFNRMLRKGK